MRLFGIRSSSTALVSSAVLQRGGSRGTAYTFLQYANGRLPGSCFGSVCERGDKAYALSLGTTLEL